MYFRTPFFYIGDINNIYADADICDWPTLENDMDYGWALIFNSLHDEVVIKITQAVTKSSGSTAFTVQIKFPSW